MNEIEKLKRKEGSNVAAAAKIEETESRDKNNGFHNIKNPENQVVYYFHLQINRLPLEGGFPVGPKAFLSHHHFLQRPILLNCHSNSPIINNNKLRELWTTQNCVGSFWYDSHAEINNESVYLYAESRRGVRMRCALWFLRKEGRLLAMKWCRLAVGLVGPVEFLWGFFLEIFIFYL